jgi:hypothetical protein
MALGAGVAADECERRSVRAENTTFGDPLAYAERLARVTPDDPDVVALIENLRRQRSTPAPTR